MDNLVWEHLEYLFIYGNGKEILTRLLLINSLVEYKMGKRKMKKERWYHNLFIRMGQYKIPILIMILLTIISAVLTSFIPIIVGKIVDVTLVDTDTSKLKYNVFRLVMVLILGNFFAAIRKYISSSVVINITTALSNDIFKKIIETKYSFFMNTHQGDILQSVTKDVRILQNFNLDLIPDFCYKAVLAVMALFFVFKTYWPLGVIGIAIYSVYLIPTRYIGKFVKRKTKQLRIQSAYLKQLLIEKLKSIDMIKIYGTEENEYEEILKEQHYWGKLLQEKYLIDQTSRTFPRVLDALIPAIVFLVGGREFFYGNLTIGNLVAISCYLPYVNAPIKSFASTFISLKEMSMQIEKINEYLKLPKEEGVDENLEVLSSIKGKVEFRNVTVKNERGLLLDHVSFLCNPGDHIALVGETGAGKSTVLKLMIGLLQPSRGEIYIDDKLLLNMNVRCLREKIGYLIQDTFLFEDSIENNLKYPEKTIKTDEMERMIAQIGLKEMVERLPASYNTSVGINGTLLSGGQKQRIGIVRTLLKNFDMLLMDEATSALDRKNEILAYQLIKEQTYNKTWIYAAHRLETVVEADKILVFRSGELIECGTHDELLSKNGYYSKLWGKNVQLEEE